MKQFYLPIQQVDEFKKFIKKYQKHVEGVSFTLSDSMEKMFRHATDDGKIVKMLHKVVEVSLIIPEQNDWKLITFFEKGFQFILDESKELEYWNPNHGKDYNRCDACGHKIQNSYVIRNEKTYEELQVGCECLKTYGVDSFKIIGRMTAELYRKYYIIGKDDIENLVLDRSYDPMKKWGRSAILKSDLLCAAKAYYNEHPAWVSSKNSENGSMVMIQSILANNEFERDDEYVAKACEYSANIDSYSEFSQDMMELCRKYYATPNDACVAYFLVKRYEEYLITQKMGTLEVGTPVYIKGNVIHFSLLPSMYSYGAMQKLFTIKTDNGRIVKRYGEVKYSGEGDKRVSFYSSVKDVKNNEVYLDRALKNPKKGIEYITI